MPPTVQKQTARPINNGQTTAAKGSLLSSAIDVGDLVNDYLKITCYGVNRVGKCLGLGTPVLMFDGSVKAVEDIEPGDVLMGPDSTPRNVLSTASGSGPLYRIIPTKGEPWVCNDEHILTLTGCKGTRVDGVIRDVSVKQYLDELERGIPNCSVWCLFRRDVEFQPQDPLRIPPYLVGLWMGDGSVGTAIILNKKEIVQQYCRSVATEHGLICNTTIDGNKKFPTVRISFVSKDRSSGIIGCNKFLNFFKLRCSVGAVKRIPPEYLTGSRKERMELLAGIIDTDGETKKISHTSVTVTGEAYRDGLLFLCHSLGFSAHVGSIKTHQCSGGKVSTYYNISISGELDSLPLRVRSFPPRRQNRRVWVERFEVEDIGDGDYYGFTLDGDGRFLLGDFTVTHNTTWACQFPKPLLLISFEPNKTGGALSVAKIPGVKLVRITSYADAVRLAVELKGNRQYKTHVLDGGTSLQDLALKKLMNLSELPEQLDWGLVNQDQYRERSELAREGLRPFLDLDANTVVLCKEKDHNPPKDMRSKVIRGLQTESYLASDLGGATVGWLHDNCDFIVRLYLEREVKTVKRSFTIGGKAKEKEEDVETGRIIHRLRTGYHPNFAAGLRSADPEQVPEIVDGESSKELYDNLMAVIRGE